MKSGEWRRSLLLIDGLAGLTAGVLILTLRDPMAALYDLPTDLLTVMGMVNLLYSLGGLSFTALRTRPAPILYTVIFANFAWTSVCLVLALRFSSTATPFGLAHLLAEGAFVAALATAEWRNRRTILGLEN